MNLQEVVAAAQRGDSKALDLLAEWLLTMLGAYLRPKVPQHEAQDICQECFLVVTRRLPEFEDRGPESFGRWVRAIADNLVKRRYSAPAHEAAKIEQLANQPRESTLSFVTKLTMLELQRLVGKCFAKLGDAQREAIVWEHEGRDDHELARLRGVAVETIWTRRHRGYRELSKHMQLARRSPLPRVRRAEPRSSSR